uniref:tetratricopeptide repeat protein n=1 Tax=Mariniflexile sp. TaxID=1979402 RepID=UPI0040476AC9
MKNVYIIISLMLLVNISFGQRKPTEKPPTQKEMQDMMKEMQQGMDEMSEEDKKMMDSMGIKMPNMKALQKTVSSVSDTNMKNAYDNKNRIVPKKDDVRIKAALVTKLSNSGMSAYINQTQQEVLQRLSPATKSKGAEIYQQIKSLNKSEGNSAVGLWMDGKPTLALYIMGEVCKENPTNAIHLNNYASFLTSCGAEQKALPILNNLNSRFPKNSSILNNIAQAWLGLGDIPRAERYADSTVRIYANHPQANMAICLIEESKGNIPAALVAGKKGISKAFSTEKVNRLKKLGYTIKSDDLNWDIPMPQDPMGLEKFTWPDFPMNVDQNELLKNYWKDFRNKIAEKINELESKQQELVKLWEIENELRTNRIISGAQNGQYYQLLPGYAVKANIKLGPGVSDIQADMAFAFTKEFEPVNNALARIKEYEDIFNRNQEEIDGEYKGEIGEGKSNPVAAYCSESNANRSQFLRSANGGLVAAYKAYFDNFLRRGSDLLYYYQYTLWPEQFELVKVNAQLTWLRQISEQRVVFMDKSKWCELVPVFRDPSQLQNFDDVSCQYVSTMNLGVYKITSSCSNLYGEFDFGGVKINLSDNVETGRYSGSALVGVSKGFEGPASIEVEASAAFLVEWDNSGFTDAGAIVGVDVNAAGQNIIGADVTITVNTGVSASGNNIFQGTK